MCKLCQKLKRPLFHKQKKLSYVDHKSIVQSDSIRYTLFFLNKNVVFPAQAEYSYFSAAFRLKIFSYYSQITAHDISVLEYTGVSIIVSAVFSFCYLVLLLKERNKLKTYNCTVFTDFHHTKLYHFQNLSLGFILKVFLKFLKFQPRYSYKKYSYRKKRVQIESESIR